MWEKSSVLVFECDQPVSAGFVAYFYDCDVCYCVRCLLRTH